MLFSDMIRKLFTNNSCVNSCIFFLICCVTAACVACGNFVLCFPDESRYAGNYSENIHFNEEVFRDFSTIELESNLIRNRYSGSTSLHFIAKLPIVHVCCIQDNPFAGIYYLVYEAFSILF